MESFIAFESDVSMFGTEYDYESVTHYPSKAFSKDGRPTIVSKKPEGEALMVSINLIICLQMKIISLVTQWHWNNIN